jgi:acyl-CoA synthetase (AMP-forming)/AMP-acid ligase II
VVLKPDRSAGDELKRELIEFSRDKLAVYKLPREVEFTGSVPRAPGPGGPGTGKLLRRLLREKTA